MIKDVLIVGAGAAGVRAAVELDERNVQVVVFEKNFYIGGILTELQRVYPVCELYLAPRFFYQLNDSPHVEIVTGAYIEEIKKSDKGYTVISKKNPRCVTEECTLCMKCVDVCERNAIHKPPFLSIPQIMFIDREKCGDCRKCEDVCPKKAINLDEKGLTITREVNNILFTAGTHLLDPEKYSEYGYKRFPDIITSLELEKMLHPSHTSKFVRPSDERRPETIAFLQCVGSRDTNKGNSYCSKICCMQALNEAKVIKEHYPDTEITIFFTDMMCFEKGWEQFYNTVRKVGVTCIRCRVPLIYEEDGSVYCRYADDQLQVEPFDMVVLSVGISPPPESFGLPLNQWGFPLSENASGLFLHPADITESVQEALASLSTISGRGRAHESIEGDDGVQIFLCTCKGTHPEMTEMFKKERYPVSVSDNLCSDEGIKEFYRKVRTKKVVIGACSLHEQLFCRLADEKCSAHVEVVNVRETTWVNPSTAESLIRMAVTKVEHLHGPITRRKVKVNPEVAIIGGGIAGLSAALELADQGSVYIIEKSSHLGGRALKIHTSLGYTPGAMVQDIIDKVERHPRISVLTETEIVACAGGCGNFLLETNRNEQISCGAIVVAVGVDEATHQYTHPRIITQTQLEERITDGDIPNTIVMIQCVGSRNDDHPWCSAVCCSKAVANSLAILEHFHGQVIILYRDMRTYGFADNYYRKARERGVIFLQNDDMPSIEVDDDTICVNYVDPILHARIIIEPDLVVLSTGMVPGEDFSKLADILGICLDTNGFFRELHPKFFPTDSTRDGIFLCGGCHSPKNVRETILQAKAAASRVRTLLSKEWIEYLDRITVKADSCTGCAICIEVCPFQALSLTHDENPVVSIDTGACKDCGLCVGCCPVGALNQVFLSDEQLLVMVESS